MLIQLLQPFLTQLIILLFFSNKYTGIVEMKIRRGKITNVLNFLTQNFTLPLFPKVPFCYSFISSFEMALNQAKKMLMYFRFFGNKIGQLIRVLF